MSRSTLSPGIRKSNRFRRRSRSSVAGAPSSGSIGVSRGAAPRKALGRGRRSVDLDQVVTARVDDLAADVAPAEGGVAGDHAALQHQALELYHMIEKPIDPTELLFPSRRRGL